MEIRLGPSCNLIQRGGESEVGPAGGLSVVRSLQACLPVCQQGRQGSLPQDSCFSSFHSLLPSLSVLVSLKFSPFLSISVVFMYIYIYGGTSHTVFVNSFVWREVGRM